MPRQQKGEIFFESGSSPARAEKTEVRGFCPAGYGQRRSILSTISRRRASDPTIWPSRFSVFFISSRRASASARPLSSLSLPSKLLSSAMPSKIFLRMPSPKPAKLLMAPEVQAVSNCAMVAIPCSRQRMAIFFVPRPEILKRSNSVAGTCSSNWLYSAIWPVAAYSAALLPMALPSNVSSSGLP